VVWIGVNEMFGCPLIGYRRLIVKQRQSLILFLNENGYPGDRAKALLSCARVYLVPSGQGRFPVTEKDAHHPLRERDVICLPMVLSPSCQRKLDTVPSIEMLIGGQSILEAIERALHNAERYVYISAWELDPDIPMPVSGLTFGQLFRERILPSNKNLRIYILWNRRLPGKVFTRKELREKAIEMFTEKFIDQVQVIGSLRKEFTWEYKPVSIAEFIGRALAQELVEWLVLGCHHTKSIVVDGRVAFCGSADLVHRVARGMAHEVTARVTGGTIRAIEEDFVDRWNRERKEHSVIPYEECMGIPIVGADRLDVRKPGPEPRPRGERRSSSVCRTDPENEVPQKRWEIDRAIRKLILDAKERIYIENQYFREPNIAKLLRAWVTKSPDRKLTILGPDVAEEIALEIEDLNWQDLRFFEQLMIFGEVETIRHLTIPENGGGYRPIDNVKILSLSPHMTPRPYIHSKVFITDPHLGGSKMVVGSANLNPRGLNGRVDYELGLLVENPKVVQKAYQDLMDLFFEGKSAFDELPDSVVENHYSHHRRLYLQALNEILEGRSFIHNQYKKFGFLL